MNKVLRMWSKNIKSRATLIIVVLTIAIIGVFFMRQTNEVTLHLAVVGGWGSLVPPLQHTSVASTLIGNAFEGLVTRGESGAIEPVLAKSWKISPEFDSIVFKVDTSRHFSNGEPLTAATFKTSWEQGFALEPLLSNSSLQDLLSVIEGYKDFSNTKTLSGVIAHDNETLEIKFSHPFRTALDHLKGARFSAYVKDGAGNYYGTGPFIIAEKNNKAYLTPNKYYPNYKDITSFNTIEVEAFEGINAVEALANGDFDALLGRALTFPDTLKNKLSVSVGWDASHSLIFVNGLEGRFFANPHHRLAIQSMLHRELRKEKNQTFFKLTYSTLDAQIFRKYQHGRLPDDYVLEKIKEGEKYEKAFIEATQTHPIILASGSIGKNTFILTIANILKENGVKLVGNEAMILEGDRSFEMINSSESDLHSCVHGVFDGDPDGIYHSLGKHGAILAPMTYRPRVGNLLEEGRALIDITKLSPHYSKVSEAVLEEVPYVHVGYMPTAITYRTDRVSLKDQLFGDFRMFHKP